ncbi:MAG TPA: hypothetical protein VEC16_04790 [Alphaproteobacteria bacterium]|nr:hypothetical protein [Alphaproteobacteria bacterium]
MKENSEEGNRKPKSFRRVLSDLEKSIQKEVHIGLKSYDEKFFNLLKDVINKSDEYTEVKKETFTYATVKLNKDQKNIYHAFAMDMYDVLIQKAKRINSQIVILYSARKRNRLDVSACYYRDKANA